MSLFNRAMVICKEEGLFKLVQAIIKYSRNRLGKLEFRYYQLRRKRTFSIGSVRIAMFVIKYKDVWELQYAYDTERSVMEEILRELKPNDVFWDVGANLGFYSLLAANCSGVDVAAFEPHPTTVKRLRKNVELNNKKSAIKVLNVALSDSEGRARFDPMELDSHGRAHLASDEISGIIEVQTSSGDKLIETGIVPRPDIVKIDVEGAEHLVIKGMRSALLSCRVLFCEVHPMYIEKYGSSAEDLEKTLKNMGFSVEKIQRRVDGTYHLMASSQHLTL